MYRLKDWYLGTSSNGLSGRGFCYDNPNFFSGQFITTSHIMRIEVENEEGQLKLFTKSGSCYVLAYAYIDEHRIDSTQEILKDMNVEVDLQRCIAFKEERLKATKEKVAELLNQNELYVIMAGGNGVAEAYFKREDDVVVSISVKVHIGTFQDSILVTDWDTGLCDWRIFPSPFIVKPYHWSDGLVAVHIENDGEDFIFMGSNREIPCKSGVVTVIKNEEYVGEGLFSPDAVNGKCAFSALFSDNEDNKGK